MPRKCICLIATLATATFAHSATIFTTTDLLTAINPMNPSQTWEVSVTSSLIDNFNGDFSKQEWLYTLTNISYVPNPIPPSVGTLIGNGTTLFAVPVSGTSPLGTGPFQNYFQPAGWSALFTGFIGESSPVVPVVWRTGNSGSAIPIGVSADFGFSIAGPIAISNTAVSVSAEAIGAFSGPVDVISGTIAVPVLVPEPGAWALLGLGSAGLLMLGLSRHLGVACFQHVSNCRSFPGRARQESRGPLMLLSSPLSAAAAALITSHRSPR